MERYRLVRTKIVQHPNQPRVLCVSSASPSDGKTVTALNTAASLALKSDTTVLLVDADLRRPQLARILGLPESPGLADVLAGTCSLEDAIVRIPELPRFHFLPSGRSSANPTELLDSPQWLALVQLFKETFTFSVIDTPPVGLLADFDLIQSACEGILLVVRPGHTKRHLLQKTLDQMPAERFLGVVVNASNDWFLWRTHDYYYSGYYTQCPPQE
jgi:capsular exopolysaccharide synthesis family protein